MSLYRMSEADLRAYAREHGLHNGSIDTLVLKVKHDLTWQEIAKQTGYSYSGVRHHRQTIIKRLGVKI